MASKKTIYITDAAEKIIGVHQDSLSGRIGSIIIRYGAITSQDCPALTVNEWLAICDILNNTYTQGDSYPHDIALYLWAEIANADRLEGLGKTWEIDALALSARVQNMSYDKQCAIIEVASRFCAGYDAPGRESNTEQLKAFGAKIS